MEKEKLDEIVSMLSVLVRNILEAALMAIGSVWWDKFYVRVNSKGVF